MASDLVKQKTLVERQEVVMVGQTIGSPARDVYEDQYICKFISVTGDGPDSTGGSGGIDRGRIWVCSTERVLVRYPAVPNNPGTPTLVSVMVPDYNLGWNAGARSVGFFTDDGHGQFSVPASVVGVICGLNAADTVDARYNGTNIDYAFSLGRGVARIIENNVFVASAGTYTSSTLFKIRRDGLDIIYSMDGADIHTTSGGATEALFLEASLYAADDSVTSPSLVQTSSPDMSEQTAELDIALPAIGIFGSDTAHTEMSVVLPELVTGWEAGLAAPAYTVVDIVIPMPVTQIDSLVGSLGQVNVTLPALDALVADHAYAEMFLALPPMDVLLYAVEGNTQASMGAFAEVMPQFVAVKLLVVSMFSTGTIASMFATEVAVSAEMMSEATLAANFTLTAAYEVVMRSVARAIALTGVPDGATETWVVNLDGGLFGSTSYTNYDFNSYARIGNKYYGASASGLFELEGDTDAGLPIRASVSLGKLDFGRAEKKTVEQCYIGMSGNGNLFVKVTAEGRSYIYKTRDFDAQLQQQRVTTGKGLRTNYVELEIYNEDGTDFEIDTVMFYVADLTRRI